MTKISLMQFVNFAQIHHLAVAVCRWLLHIAHMRLGASMESFEVLLSTRLHANPPQCHDWGLASVSVAVYVNHTSPPPCPRFSAYILHGQWVHALYSPRCPRGCLLPSSNHNRQRPCTSTHPYLWNKSHRIAPHKVHR